MITRVYAIRTWLFGLFSSIYSVLGLWGGIIIAGIVLAGSWPDSQLTSHQRSLLLLLPIVFGAAQIVRASLRQKMIGKLLHKDKEKMRAACIADILLSWLFSLMLLFYIIASAFGRQVTWRSIRYKLVSPSETQIIDN